MEVKRRGKSVLTVVDSFNLGRILILSSVVSFYSTSSGMNEVNGEDSWRARLFDGPPWSTET